MRNEPTMPNRDENPAEQESLGLEAATSFDELYEMLDELGNIEGTGKTYSTDEIKDEIELLRRGEGYISNITRSHGLRSIVQELLKDDPVYKERDAAVETEEAPVYLVDGKCSGCGKENMSGNDNPTYCPNCGQEVIPSEELTALTDNKCARCGKENMSGNDNPTYCPNCGKKVIPAEDFQKIEK